MQVHSIINSSSLAKQLPARFPTTDHTENCDVSVRSKPSRSSIPRTTTDLLSMFHLRLSTFRTVIIIL